MLKKRIIPCLDIKDGRTVKGINFENIRDAGDPVELAKRYTEEGADELVFLDITATIEKRKTLTGLVTRIATEINIPFITSDASGPKHLVLKMTRAKLEEIADEFITRAIQITKRAIEASPYKIADIQEIILVGGQTRMPKIKEVVKELFGREPNQSINPDEVVALGAAVQGGILAGDVKDILLLDVIPLSLGIETMGGVATHLIERNTTIPTSRSQIFSTAADNQTSTEIHIVQGERAMATDNKSLGRFVLDGIPPAPRGIPQVEVTFDVDANGILNVKAKDKASGKENTIRIEASTGLSKDDIERMKKEAEAHEGDDKKKKELIEVRNTADQAIYTAEKSLRENKDKLSAELVAAVETKIGALRLSKDKDEMDVIKTDTDALSMELAKVHDEVSKANPANAGSDAGAQPTGENPGPAPEGEVKDAEVKE